MNRIRNWTTVVALAAFGVLAFPAHAAKKPPGQGQDKSYGLEFLMPFKLLAADGTTLLNNPSYQDGTAPGDRLIQPPVTIVVYVKNESPPSTAASNAGSVTFTLAPSLVLVNQADAVTCPRGICMASGNTVTVTNISPPIQAKEIFPITLKVNTCVVVNEALISNVVVSTGSQITGGVPFSPYFDDPTFKYETTLSTRGSPDALITPDTFTTSEVPVHTGISCGNISCLQHFSIGNQDPANQPYQFVSGWRGLNADGTCSGATNLSYFVTNQLGASSAPDRLVHFTWASQPSSPQVFAYKLTRSSLSAGTSWDLGWLTSNGQLVTIAAVPQLVCNGGLLPTPPTTIDDLPLPSVYGTLTQDVKPNSKQIKVDTGGNTPPTITGDGLPIVIQTERMLVTSISSNGWNVSRTSSLSHPAGSAVASTPMPLLLGGVPAPYVTNDPAKMCLAWTDGTSAWIIDASDGWGVPR